ncbi:hypothetical protein LTR40_013844, partial [Exophiala xenobiotica]
MDVELANLCELVVRVSRGGYNLTTRFVVGGFEADNLVRHRDVAGNPWVSLRHVVLTRPTRGKYFRFDYNENVPRSCCKSVSIEEDVFPGSNVFVVLI